jgi:hypothetical protein
MNYRNDSTVRLIQHMGSDAHIASAAWVSSSEAGRPIPMRLSR